MNLGTRPKSSRTRGPGGFGGRGGGGDDDGPGRLGGLGGLGGPGGPNRPGGYGGLLRRHDPFNPYKLQMLGKFFGDRAPYTTKWVYGMARWC